MTKVAKNPFATILTSHLVPAGQLRPLSILEVCTLTHEYCDRFNQDVETVLSYVLAGTDRHDVNPGPCDTYSTVTFESGAYMWNHDNIPEPVSETESYCEADARIDYRENFCD